MNKDLDERLVPNGEYRDALNIQVGSSEGSDVGAIENILGNQVARLKKAQPATNWDLKTGSTNYYGLPLDAKCIGAIKDDINDKIYWFVTSSAVDCIIEYKNQFGQVRPVLVDTQNILNFSATKLITGINILDNYLFFTDNISEPKKVNVASGVFSSANFTTHSQYKGRNFIESDITVIKKSPLTAPTIESFNTLRRGNILTSSVHNFGTYTLGPTPPQNTGGIIDSVGVGYNYNNSVLPAGTDVITLNANINVDYQIGDLLTFTADAPSTHLDYEEYLIEVRITGFYLFNGILGTVEKIPAQILDEEIAWTVELRGQEDPVFEKKFPRFGYRWKYEDNQYSAFSPFTEVAFLPGLFKYNSQEGFNTGMSNTAVVYDLEITEAAPIDVKEIELLYKETNNTAIYIVETFTPKNFPQLASFSDISTSSPFYYTVTNELLYRIVESNQLLRPWDNVPRLAKAQEIVGNRIVYGNYLQNYTWDNDLLRFLKVSYEGPLAAQGTIGQKSIKTLRDYQIGIVFKDEYGRETPVFTNNNLQTKIPISAAANQNSIKIQRGGSPENPSPYSPPPPFATHFKYFIKSSNNEYYNLAVDRAYPSDDPTGIWLSFPSADRNKVTEDDYLILKKGAESDYRIELLHKYKILSIKNDAPPGVKTVKRKTYEEQTNFANAFPNATSNLTSAQAGLTPDIGANSVTFYSASGLFNLKNSLTVGGYVRFTDNGGQGSSFYKIVSINPSTSADSPTAIKVYFEQRFDTDINFMYVSGTLTNRYVEIYENKEREPGDAQFDGRFFVKINGDEAIDNNVRIVTSDYFPYDSIVAAHNQYSFGNIIIFGAGVPRGFISNPGSTVGSQGGYLAGGNGDEPSSDILGQNWDLILERKVGQSYNESFWSAMQSVGTKLTFSSARFFDDPSNNSGDDTIYRVEAYTLFVSEPGTSQSYQRLYIRLRDIEAGIYDQGGLKSIVNPMYIDSQPLFSETGYEVGIELVRNEDNSLSKSGNPAIFEIEPREQPDLDIYYEASDALPISDWGSPYTLNWYNCFTFGNGVESNRIRDDFNAPFIDVGTKASAVLEEPYEEERRATGLIYSGIYNSTSGLNNLNQFIQAEKITKDLNPIYGSIQKLHTRDTNLVAMCEDKVLRILANKDALFNADGNVNVTSNNNVLGQAVPFAGEFGISKNPESFASYGYRAYFSDKKRGVVLRLSMDGLTEISSKGMSDYFYDNLKAATTVLGSYDIYSDTYNLTLNNDTVCFKESSDGWPTRKSYIPEWGISLNADYYTMNNGMLWSHDNETRNTFYEGAATKSSVQLIFNDNPSKIKNFKTLSYEGTTGWTAPLIQTDQQDGQVTTFLDKENIYYNYIRGAADTWDNAAQAGTLDLKQFAAQGIGNPSSISTYNGNTTFTVTVKNDPVN